LHFAALVKDKKAHGSVPVASLTHDVVITFVYEADKYWQRIYVENIHKYI